MFPSLSFFTVSFTLPSWSVKVNSNSSAFNSRPVSFLLALILALALLRLFVTVLIAPSCPTVISNGVGFNSYPSGASTSVTVKFPFLISLSE